jgi:hypothetical protein
MADTYGLNALPDLGGDPAADTSRAEVDVFDNAG